MIWAVQKMKGQRWTAAMFVASAFIALGFLTFCQSGCTAVPAVAGYFTSGGVTLYKSAKESGPKAEFVLFKTEINVVQPVK